MPPRMMKRRLNTLNCEFLLRSQIGISEFASIVLANMHYLEENAEILDKGSLEAFLKKTEKIVPYLHILDSKNEKKDMLHFIYQDIATLISRASPVLTYDT